MRALKNGSVMVTLSAVICGWGCLIRKQFAKGALYLAAELAIIYYMIKDGAHHLSKLVTLGDVAQQKVWNEAKSLYEYVDGDRSLVILLYGIVTVAVLLGVLAFTILPLLFMTSMAFTNYSVLDNKLVLFDWVGFDNFRRLVDLNGSLGQTFWSVLGWTLCWAFIATFSNYILGMLLALYINAKGIKFKGFWRFCFVLTVAVPHFVTLLIIRQMLQPAGAVNVLLQNLGWISSPLPFFTDITWSRVTVILIGIWVSVPYVLLQITGILQNIPHELYESARVDGAGPVVTFFKITLPYMLFVTTPYLITSFTGNINNFNTIFLTSKGLPRAVESTAGSTDLLITWLYKLTIDNQYYDVGAVIGIMTFLTLSVVSLLTFRYSGSYKNEEGFR